MQHFAELRQLLMDPSRPFTKILALIISSEQPERQLLLDYAESHLKDWPDEARYSSLLYQADGNQDFLSLVRVLWFPMRTFRFCLSAQLCDRPHLAKLTRIILSQQDLVERDFFEFLHKPLCYNLEYLYLVNTNFTNNHARLLLSVKGLEKLQYLDLHANPQLDDQEVISALKARFKTVILDT